MFSNSGGSGPLQELDTQQVESKSHISEIYGNECQAGAHSRGRVERALDTAKEWCGADTDADWTGPLYQSANCIAHLYFICERLKFNRQLE